MRLFQDYKRFNKAEKYHEWSGYGKGMSGNPFMELDKLVGYVLDHARESGKAEGRMKILDIGCGMGSVSLPLASLGFSVKGIDIDEKSISWAKQHNPFENAEFTVGDAERLVGVEGEFDVIVCTSILEHLKQPLNTLNHCAYLIRHDGVLLIVVPNGYGPHELSSRYIVPLLGGLVGKVGTKRRRILEALGLGRIQRSHETGGCDSPQITLNQSSPHIQVLTFGRLISLLEVCNFTVVKKEHSNVISGTRPFSYLLRRIKALEYIDWKIADILPSFLVSGWYVVCRPSAKHLNKNGKEADHAVSAIQNGQGDIGAATNK